MKNNKKSTHLIIGAGEVGRGLFKVLSARYRVFIRDIEGIDFGIKKFDVLHIAYPYFKTFIAVSRKYINKYHPGLIINHSSVPVGVTSKLGKKAVHSPIRGVHPNLDKGIKTFVKYFGGPKSKEAADIFKCIGVLTHVVSRAEWTEAGKLWDTTQYGYSITLNKEIWKWCQKNKVPFEFVYGDFNKTYNEGYLKLGRSEVMRPYLKHVSGKIGGHCVIPNCNLLDSTISQEIIKKNKKLI